MLIPIRLRSRLTGIFCAMAFIVLACCGALLWNSHQVNTMLDRVVGKEITLYKITQDMELALANQKGFLTYYFVDGDGKWLDALARYRDVFQLSLDQAKGLDMGSGQLDLLDAIDDLYRTYIVAKDQAIRDYQRGVPQLNISGSHEAQRGVFFSLLDLCRTFSEEQWQVITQAEQQAIARSKTLRLLAWGSMAVFLTLSVLFVSILYRQVLEPIRNMAIETGSSPKDSYMDEVESLTQSLKGMMEDFDTTHDELARSRVNLLQAERMAVIGELAAGVAHTIRNPLTSVKMRMFSLAQSLNLTAPQNEDLQVISDEIVRIDKIVTNFLEFARPPKLTIKRCNLRDLVEATHTLLKYRLRHYGATLVHQPEPDLPEIDADPDRIKEALLNLITNSCEAMEHGGEITIRERLEEDTERGAVVVLEIHDTGPGIPETLRYKVTAPFFTTREDGSGLGLAIVARIVKEHRGALLISDCDMGCTIMIKLPMRQTV